MPELPEVETVKNDLLPLVQGRTFTDVAFFWPKAAQTPNPEEFKRRLVGRAILDITRRGKYIIFRLTDGEFLLVHLRMTGQLLFRKGTDTPDRYTHTVLKLDEGHELRFADLRKFGALWLVRDPEEVVGDLGPEPFSEEFTPEYLANGMARRSSPIKAALLDQNFIAGIGNIYADETLFEARIHPARKANSLSQDETNRLYNAIKSVLTRGIANRGTSLQDYTDAFGREGHNQEQLRVFRRKGLPCPNCGTPIVRATQGGRGTFFCPVDQPLEE